MLNVREYHRVSSIEEALELLRKQPAASLVSGGTALIGESPENIETVIDISALPLDQIALDREHNLLTLGANVTHQMLVEGAGDLPLTPMFEILCTTAHAMSGLNIRNRATLGGALATADSASPLVTALLACDAEVSVWTASASTDKPRTLPLAGFLSYRAQILAEGALITHIRLPLADPAMRFAYDRVARTPRDYPIVCAVARCAMKDGIVGSVRIALGGVAATPIRLPALELGLEKKPLLDFLDRELLSAISALNPPSDWLGSAEYRREMAGVLARRAILRAAQAAQG
ncbi:MAG: FAD binding domain-containing protein [Anaerolineae bacterium]|nr:FAD binding domain-containing protein [Thermoflexales bacterium]MDW8408548.1 FAD binding domain-containing protein [Anaerolineae bacterium]